VGHVVTSSRLNTLRGVDPTQTRAHDQAANLLNPIASALGKTPILGAPPPPWVRLTPGTGLSGVVTSTEDLSPAYHVDALGYVHLSGGVTSAVGVGALTVAFTLPPEARPTKTRPLVGFGNGGAPAGYTVGPTGAVTMYAALGPGQTTYFDGIIFLAGA